MEIDFDLPPIFDVYDDEDFGSEFQSTFELYEDFRDDIKCYQQPVFDVYQEDEIVVLFELLPLSDHELATNEAERNHGLVKGAHELFDKIPHTKFVVYVAISGFALVGTLYLFAKKVAQVILAQGATQQQLAIFVDKSLIQENIVLSWPLKYSFDPGTQFAPSTPRHLLKCRRSFDFNLSLQDKIKVCPSVLQVTKHSGDGNLVVFYYQLQHRKLALKYVEHVHKFTKGFEIYEDVFKTRFAGDVFVCTTTLMNFYGHCGGVSNASRVFDEMHEREIVLRNTVIGVFSATEFYSEALELFYRMPLRANDVSWNSIILMLAFMGPHKDFLTIFIFIVDGGIMKQNHVTISSMLIVLVDLECFLWGKEIHASCLRNNIETDIFVGDSFMDLYSKSGSSIHLLLVLNDSGNDTGWLEMYPHVGVNLNTTFMGDNQHLLIKFKGVVSAGGVFHQVPPSILLLYHKENKEVLFHPKWETLSLNPRRSFLFLKLEAKNHPNKMFDKISKINFVLLKAQASIFISTREFRLLTDHLKFSFLHVFEGYTKEVEKNDVVITFSETSSAKTTQLPRPVVAATVAKRMAEECGIELRHKVRYSIHLVFCDLVLEFTVLRYLINDDIKSVFLPIFNVYEEPEVYVDFPALCGELDDETEDTHILFNQSPKQSVPFLPEKVVSIGPPCDELKIGEVDSDGYGEVEFMTWRWKPNIRNIPNTEPADLQIVDVEYVAKLWTLALCFAYVFWQYLVTGITPKMVAIKTAGDVLIYLDAKVVREEIVVLVNSLTSDQPNMFDAAKIREIISAQSFAARNWSPLLVKLIVSSIALLDIDGTCKIILLSNDLSSSDLEIHLYEEQFDDLVMMKNLGKTTLLVFLA